MVDVENIQVYYLKKIRRILPQGASNPEGLYIEFSKIENPQQSYEYLLDKAKTMNVSTGKNKSIFYAVRNINSFS